MRTVGLVVEYNPLHNGHLYHIQQAKQAAQADAVVAIMSGPFLQRGEPAIVDKWARAEMALHAGVDLVIELPSLYACSAAERFASGAIRMLDATGMVDAVCFGSEHGEITAFESLTSHILDESTAFKTVLNQALQSGFNYPTAYAKSLEMICSRENLTFDASQPNNILGLFYTLAIKRLNSSIQPLTIQRIASGYNDLVVSHPSIASATALRQAMASNLESIASYVPASTLHILKREFTAKQGPMTWDCYFPSLLHQISTISLEQLGAITDVREGLESRIKQALYVLEQHSFSNLLKAVATKRYTKTNLQRIFTNILLNRTSYQESDYIRILGFTEKGQHLLKRMRKTATFPIISRVTQAHFNLLAEDLKASYAYTLGYPAPTREQLRRELMQAPIQL